MLMLKLKGRIWAIAVIALAILVMGQSCEVKIWTGDELKYFQTLEQELDFAGKDSLSLENSVGKIEIQGWTEPKVKLSAIKRAKTKADLEKINIVIEQTGKTIKIRSEYLKKNLRGAVDYVLKIPNGASLMIENGVGDMHITNFWGSSVELDLGVGELELAELHPEQLEIDLGVGEADLGKIAGKQINVDVDIGTGSVKAQFPKYASLVIEAEVGMGDINLEGFSGVEYEGFISKSIRVVLGAGEGSLSIKVGVGSIKLRAVEGGIAAIEI